MKKRSEETQTLHTGCSEAEPKIFAPPQTRFPGAQDGQNSICWKWSLPLPTNPVWRGSMHAISSYGSNRHTNTHTPTDRTGYNTLRCSFTSVQCNHTSTDTTITFHCCYCAFTLDCAFIYARDLWTHITDSRTSVNWQTCSYYVPATIGRRRKAMLLSDVCLTSVCLTSSVCRVHRA